MCEWCSGDGSEGWDSEGWDSEVVGDWSVSVSFRFTRHRRRTRTNLLPRLVVDGGDGEYVPVVISQARTCRTLVMILRSYCSRCFLRWCCLLLTACMLIGWTHNWTTRGCRGRTLCRPRVQRTKDFPFPWNCAVSPMIDDPWNGGLVWL